MYGCAATSICNTIDRKKANDRECLPLLLLMIIVEVFLCVVVVCCLLLGCCGHEFWVLQFWYIGYLVHSLGIDDSTTRLVLLCLLAVVFFLYVTNRRASRPNFDNFTSVLVLNPTYLPWFLSMGLNWARCRWDGCLCTARLPVGVVLCLGYVSKERRARELYLAAVENATKTVLWDKFIGCLLSMTHFD